MGNMSDLTHLEALALAIFGELEAGNYPGSKLEAIESILRRDDALLWTSDKPTQPGWYWWRSAGEQRVVQVVTNDSDCLALWYHASEVVRHMDGEWAGPLVLPQEATR